MNIDMAKRFVNRRRAAGLSQEALAEELGVSRQAVSKWERSESSPDTDNLIALAALYDVSLDDLLYQDVADEGQRAEGRAEAPGGTVAAAGAKGSSVVGAEAGRSAAADQDDPAAVEVEAEVIDEGAPAGSDEGADGGTSGAQAAPGMTSKDGTVHIGPDGIHVQEADGKDYVHITWRDGVHVRDASRGDEVHVGWDGVHVNDRSYNDWHEAHADWKACSCKPQSKGWRNWNLFPFPLVVMLFYIVTAFESGAWVPELALFLAIPVYYALGGLLFGKRACAFFCTLYAMGTVGWFFQMCLWGEPHPAWVMLVTIPLVCGLFGAISHWWHHRKEA